jgi:hypothetical protein
MRYINGDKVKVVIPQFKDLYEGHNVWVIDHIKVQNKGYPSLYICYNDSDKNKMLFHFLEEDVEKIE